MMPEVTNVPPGARNSRESGASGRITSATMFASTMSKFVPSAARIPLSARISPAYTRNRSAPMPLSAALSIATSGALGSMSQPTASRQPSTSAPMERIPLPQPRSSTRLSGAASVSMASRHMRVVAWLPVPKMRPGSSRSATRPSAGCSSHAGTTTSFSPIGRGL